MSDPEQGEIKVCKVVLLGETGVGKTCIIDRYVKKVFNVNVESTTGAAFVSKITLLENGHKVRLDIWDTAGQEQYRSLNQFFYRDAAVAILVYDITRAETFNAIKEYWYNEVKDKVGDKIIVGIAGNKCDLFAEENVSEGDVKTYATDINAAFRLTSASENIGIDELFFDIVNKFDDSSYEFGKEKQTKKDDPKKQSVKLKQTTKKEEQQEKIEKKKKGCC